MDYKCESCGRDYGLLCLTPTHGRVKIYCGSCFGESLLSGDNDNKIYLPSQFIGEYKKLTDEYSVIFYNVLVW